MSLMGMECGKTERQNRSGKKMSTFQNVKPLKLLAHKPTALLMPTFKHQHQATSAIS